MDTCIVRPQTALKRISASGKKGFSKRLQSRLWPLALSGILMFSCTSLWASSQTDNFRRLAVVQRAEALQRMSPKLILRPLQPVVLTSPNLPFAAGFPVAEPYPWKYNITTTVFWVGEKAAPQNPVSNEQSAWDPDWMSALRRF